MPRSKNENLMSLAVMSLLDGRPMHPYEMSSLMKNWGLTYSIKLNTGNLYATISSLVSEGLLSVREVDQLTAAGVAFCKALLRDIIGKPVKEYPRFVAGLSFMSHLPPAEVEDLLENRLAELKSRKEAERAGTEEARSRGIDELFLVEMDYSLHMLEAEIQWTEKLRKAVSRGEMTVRTRKGIQWRATDGDAGRRPAADA